MLFLLLTAVLGQYMKLPAGGGWNAASYATGDEADAACQSEGYALCSIDAFKGAAAQDSLCVDVGFLKAGNDGSYTRGSSCSGSFSTWVPAGSTGGHAHCCQPTYYNIYYNMIGDTNSVDAAEAYCTGQSMSLCSVRQVKNAYTSGGETVPAVSSWYADGTVGYYNGAQDRWDASTAAWTGYTNGIHCCTEYAYVPTDTYGIIPEDEQYASSILYNGEDANNFCINNGWSGLCTVGQLSTGAGKCVVGWAFTDDSARSLAEGAAGKFHSSGYWGNCGDSGNGADGQWNDHYQPADNDLGLPVAHCCMNDIASPDVPFRVYRTNSLYYSSKEDAQAVCDGMGPDTYTLCTRGQLKRLATETFSYSNGFNSVADDNMCNNAWSNEGELIWYQMTDQGGQCGYSGEAGWASTPGAVGGAPHCCLNFDGVTDQVPVYETLKYSKLNYDDAQARCREGADLCSRDQLAMLARQDVTFDGQTQAQITNMCNFGWSKEGDLGWWQTENDPGCVIQGTDQWNGWDGDYMGAYHCCLGFTAPSSTRPYETRQYFNYDAATAAARCGTGAELCTQRQVYRAATESFEHDGMTHDPATEYKLCNQGWLNDGSQGWWQKDQGACGDDIPNGWESFNSATAAFHCCLPFEGLDLPAEPVVTDAPVTDAPVTDAPVTDAPVTDAPVTDAPVTDAPTETDDSLGNLPSSKDQPEGCTAWDWTPTGFDGLVSYCVSDGMIYLEGYSTCVLADEDANAALETSWNNDWYFGASQDCTDRDTDQTTDDQLWVTNKMCDNLEADIDALAASTSNYMDSWTQDVTDLVNANMANFDEATQDQLTALLATLNGN